MNTPRPDRASLAVDALTLLQELPRFGRVMIALGRDGVAHERLGIIESVSLGDGVVRIGGDGVETVIETDALGPVIADRTVKMKDRVLPKLEMCGLDGATLFSVHGLDGLEPFDAALAGTTEAPLPPKARDTSASATLEDDDAGLALLQKAHASGLPVTIDMVKDGVRQSRSGAIEEIKPMMGFVNVIRPDFHLHVRGGLIARWSSRMLQSGEVEYVAEDASGTAIGLTLRGVPAAFAS